MPALVVEAAIDPDPPGIAGRFGNGAVQCALLFAVELFHRNGRSATGANLRCNQVTAQAVMVAVVMDFAEERVARVLQPAFNVGHARRALRSGIPDPIDQRMLLRFGGRLRPCWWHGEYADDPPQGQAAAQ